MLVEFGWILQMTNKSLIIISQPRSISTLCYRVCHNSIADIQSIPMLKNRTELLNSVTNPMCKAIPHLSSETFYPKLATLLYHYRFNHIVKDVVQTPNLVKFLNKHPNAYNRLILLRNIADVAYFMLKQNWLWPLKILNLPHNTLQEKIQKNDILPLFCLSIREIREKYIQQINCPIIHHNDFISSETYIYDILEDFGYTVTRKPYIGKTFRFETQKRQQQKATRLYKHIEAIFSDIKNQTLETILDGYNGKVEENN